MPRKRRRFKARTPVTALQPSVRRFLETGRYAVFAREQLAAGENWVAGMAAAGLVSRDCERGRRLWELHRDDVLRNWGAEHPGTRPHAWWTFEAKEPRAVLADRSRRVVQPRQPGDWGFYWQEHRGVPFHGHAKCPGDQPIVIEAEPAYLERCGVLTADERGRIPVEWFEPDTIDDLPLATAPSETANEAWLRR